MATSLSIVKYVITLAISYVRYFFLSILIVTLILALLIITDALISLQNVSFFWLQYFSFILPKLSSSSFALNLSDVMILLNVLALVLLIIGLALKHLLLKKIRITIKLPRRRQWLIGVSLITIVFITAIIVVPFFSLSPDTNITEMYIVLVAFGTLAVISYTCYALLGWLPDFLIKPNKTTSITS